MPRTDADENEDDFASVDWDKVKARELRKACIHECAHAAIARYFGSTASVTIIANPAASIDQKFYFGRVDCSPKLSKATKRLVSLAGTIAEQFDEDHEVTGHDIATRIEHEAITFSEKDADGAGGYTRQHLDECVALVRKLWIEIEREASQQMAQQVAGSAHAGIERQSP